MRPADCPRCAPGKLADGLGVSCVLRLSLGQVPHPASRKGRGRGTTGVRRRRRGALAGRVRRDCGADKAPRSFLLHSARSPSALGVRYEAWHVEPKVIIYVYLNCILFFVLIGG